MATEYWQAGDDVERIAADIISDHHGHLVDADILFLFRDKASTKNGKSVAGTASRFTAKERAIAGRAYAFKIELAFDLWTLQNEAWRRALIDHELCHCNGNSEDGWEIRAHDLEEFAEIVQRHGLWNWDVKNFCENVDQLDLFAEAE